MSGTQLIVFGGLNGQTYNKAGLYICEMEHMKVLKQIMSNGKKRTYFEDSPSKKLIMKTNMKFKKEQSMLEMIKNRPSAQLTKIQILEKQLKESQ